MTKKKITLFLFCLCILGALLGVARYVGWFGEAGLQRGERAVVQLDGSIGKEKIVEENPPPYNIERVAEGLFVPWSIVFTSPSRMLVSERSGAIRLIENGLLAPEPLYAFAEVPQNSEEGLMGLAVDPEYSANRFLYACLAYEKNGRLWDKVVRLVDDGGSIREEKIIVDMIPSAQYHAGCRLGFGPDKKLYITTGEATQKEIAQDLSSLGGKILRVNTDGSIPEDNPFLHSPVYSYGHRNPQGIAWDAKSGALLSTEHGPSLFDGPAGGDEINLIIPGGNYGWPLFSHDKNSAGFIAPLIQFTPAVAPASALLYSGKVFAAWEGVLFFGGLKGEGIFAVHFADDSLSKVASYEKLDIDLGRIRDVVEGPDGFIYFSTSNRDGRGRVRAGDDAIYRIVPK